MKKIVVIGSGGSGKSTLARKIGDITKLPVYHLDALYWRSGWVATPHEEWDSVQRNLIQLDEWIIDGNYGRTLDIRMEAADTIVFFDLSRWVTTYRVLKRRVMYHGRSRPDLTEGCPEKLDMEFVRWVWNFRRDKRPAIVDKLNYYSNTKKIITLQSNSDVRQFTAQLIKDQGAC
ncbi:MAG: DNA topology modulation protein [Candidatus Pristimantibacillus sp.]